MDDNSEWHLRPNFVWEGILRGSTQAVVATSLCGVRELGNFAGTGADFVILTKPQTPRGDVATTAFKLATSSLYKCHSRQFHYDSRYSKSGIPLRC